MNNISPTIAAALAPFTPPEPVKPSLVVDCPACWHGWRDVGDRTVMCGQCRGTGRMATNGGEA